MHEIEPPEITIWREYKDRLRSGQDAKVIVRDIANRLDKGVGYVSNLIWQHEVTTGEFYCRINQIDGWERAEIEQ